MAEPPDWEWWYGATKDAHLPLSILQLDPADRAVLRIAGKYEPIVSQPLHLPQPGQIH